MCALTEKKLATWPCAPKAGGFLCSWANETGDSWGKGWFPTPDLLSVPLRIESSKHKHGHPKQLEQGWEERGNVTCLLLSCLIVSPYSALWNRALRGSHSPAWEQHHQPIHLCSVSFLLSPSDCTLQGCIINAPTSATCFYRHVSLPGWFTLDVCTLSMPCKEKWALQWQEAQCTGLSL